MHSGPKGSGVTGPPHFLLVEDDDLLGAASRRLLEGFGVVSLAATFAQALLLVRDLRLTGIVADISLPDGSGFDVARAARARAPDLPILFISGELDSDQLRVRLVAAHQLGAMYLVKPVDPEQLALFAERAVSRHRRVELLLNDWIDRYALSAAEAVTLRLAVQGMHREEIAIARGVSAGTVRNQVGGLLAKVGAASLNEAVAAFFREFVTP